MHVGAASGFDVYFTRRQQQLAYTAEPRRRRIDAILTHNSWSLDATLKADRMEDGIGVEGEAMLQRSLGFCRIVARCRSASRFGSCDRCKSRAEVCGTESV